MAKFWAAEPHVNGTTQYAIGDTREADETEVQHLVDLGVLSMTEVAPLKAETSFENKAEGKTPSNKSA